MDGIPQPDLLILADLVQATDINPNYLGKKDVLSRFRVFSKLECLIIEGLLRIYQVF